MSNNTVVSCNRLATILCTYSFSALSPVIFYAIHCKVGFSLTKSIAYLILAQAAGLYFIIKQLYDYYQQSLEKFQETQNHLIDKKIKKPLHHNKYLFTCLVLSTILAQLSNVILDTFSNIVYFTYNKIKTWHYILIILLCIVIGFIPGIISEYMYGSTQEEIRTQINDKAKNINSDIKNDVITKPALPLTKATVIYLITVAVPAVISAVHAAYNLKPYIIIICIGVSQLIGSALIIADLYTYAQTCVELENYLKTIQTQQNNSHINKKQVAGIICAVLLGQWVAVGIDAIVSRLYFAYEMVSTTQYITTILACAIAGILIPLSYEYVCSVKESIATEVTNVQAEVLGNKRGLAL